MPSGNRHWVTMTFRSVPSGFIDSILPRLSSRTNSRGTTPSRPSFGFELAPRVLVILLSFHRLCLDSAVRAGLRMLPTWIAQSSDVAFLTSPKTLAQQPLENLAATTLRQLGFREFDVAGDFVDGEET